MPAAKKRARTKARKPVEIRGYHPRVNVEATMDYSEEKDSLNRHRVRIHLEIPFEDSIKWLAVKAALDLDDLLTAQTIVLDAAPTGGKAKEQKRARALIKTAIAPY